MILLQTIALCTWLCSGKEITNVNHVDNIISISNGRRNALLLFTGPRESREKNRKIITEFTKAGSVFDDKVAFFGLVDFESSKRFYIEEHISTFPSVIWYCCRDDIGDIVRETVPRFEAAVDFVEFVNKKVDLHFVVGNSRGPMMLSYATFDSVVLNPSKNVVVILCSDFENEICGDALEPFLSMQLSQWEFAYSSDPNVLSRYQVNTVISFPKGLEKQPVAVTDFHSPTFSQDVTDYIFQVTNSGDDCEIPV